MKECKSIEEVRANIDRIDRDIVKLIAERNFYVGQAAHFKKDTDDVKDSKRVEQVIEKVRQLANEHAVDPDIVEGIYRKMIESFINLELDRYQELSLKSKE